MRLLLQLSLCLAVSTTASAVWAGPFPHPLEDTAAIALVEVRLPRRGPAKARVVRWVEPPKRRYAIARAACQRSARGLGRHKRVMWGSYWALRKDALGGSTPAMKRARREWKIKGQARRRLVDEALRRGRYQAVVYYRLAEGKLLAMCDFVDVIYLRHWTRSPEHASWLRRERKRRAAERRR